MPLSASFESAFRHASIGMALVAPDGRFLRANSAFCGITGYSEAELQSRDAHSVTHPDDLEVSLARIVALAAGEIESYELEKRYVTKAGGAAWVRLSVSPVRDPAGVLQHYVTLAQDISDRRAAEAARAASDARYRTIIEATSDVLVITRLDGVVDFVNPAIEAYGWRADDIIGRRFIDDLHPDDRQAVVDASVALVRNGGVARPRWRARPDPNTPWRWFESHACAVRDADGSASMVVDVVRDVEEQVRADAAIAAAQAAAEEATRIKSAFIANISHEIRTPLTAVLGFTELLKQGPELPSEARDFVERIDLAGRGLLALVNDVLDFSRLEAGAVEIRPQPTSLPGLAAEVLAIFGTAAGAKGLPIKLSVGPELQAPREVDPDRLRQVLINLIGNAVKFTERGEVRLEMSAEGDALAISVADTGPGIAADAQGALFQRFSQVDGSRTRAHGGAGLGLAITRGIVEAMGGRIELESASGCGARFTVFLQAPVAGDLPAPEDAPLDSLHGLRVLVVDDNPSNRLVADRLLSTCGAVVRSVGDGPAALEALEAEPYDAILLDLRMPGMDGFETLARLRQGDGPNARTPTFAFSADLQADRPLQGFQGFVRKPIEPLALLRSLASL